MPRSKPKSSWRGSAVATGSAAGLLLGSGNKVGRGVGGGVLAGIGGLRGDDVMAGVGPGLAVQGLVFLLLDWAVLDRAEGYAAALQLFRP